MTEFHTNPTQVTGLLVFAIAAVACARTAIRLRPPAASLWWGLSAMQAAFVGEVALGLRHRVHDLVDAVLQERGWYASRSTLQVVLIAIALMLAAGSVAALKHWRRFEPRAMPAMVCSVAVLWSFVIEAISLHRVDAVMYFKVGPVMLVACGWAMASAVVTVAAIRSARL
jgi:hypothetical protein